jgi:hypothetical protein
VGTSKQQSSSSLDGLDIIPPEETVIGDSSRSLQSLQSFQSFQERELRGSWERGLESWVWIGQADVILAREGGKGVS